MLDLGIVGLELKKSAPLAYEKLGAGYQKFNTGAYLQKESALNAQIWLTKGPDHVVFYANHFALDFAKDPFGKKFVDLFTPGSYRDNLKNLLDQAYNTGESLSIIDEEYIDSQGKFRYWSGYLSPTYLDNQTRVLMGVFFETTEAVLISKAHLAREDLLSEQLQQWQKVLQDMRDPILILSTNLKILSLNRAAETLFGLEQKEVLRTDFLTFIQNKCTDPQDLTLEDLPLLMAQKGKYGSPLELTIQIATQEEVLFEMSAAPIQDNLGQISALTVTLQRIKRKITIDQAGKEVLCIASHEIRNPLGIARGLVQLIQMRFKRRMEAFASAQNYLREPANNLHSDLEDYHKDFRQLECVLQNIDKMNQLIGELMDVNRLDSDRNQFDLEPVDLSLLLDEVAQRIQTVTFKHQIINNVDAKKQGQFWVKGDCLRLEQVIVNLITNAIKYSLPPNKIEVGIIQKDGQVQLWVQDQGIGIPKAEQAKLFKSFFRASNVEKRGTEGLGLGLFICAEIIWEHGGKIWVESEMNQGSTFYISLPVYR